MKTAKLLSVILLLCLITSMFSVMASADSITETETYVFSTNAHPKPMVAPKEEGTAGTQSVPVFPETPGDGGTSLPVTNGVYRIKNVSNGKYLNTENGGMTEGTSITQWTLTPY